jgi:hypothetical protein
MTKVKIKKHQIIEEETDFEYPVYLYFQDENCMDELIKVEENHQIRVKYSYFGVTIERSTLFTIEEHYLINNQTTKEHFEETLKEALNTINSTTNILTSNLLLIENLINAYKKEYLKYVDEPFHYEAEIASGFNDFIEWLKHKEQ